VAGSLEGPIAKMTRAERHIDVLKREVETIWTPREPRPVRTEGDKGGLEYRFYLGELPEIKAEWPLIIGEILFDLRSALDHLAFQLCVRQLGGDLPPNIEKASQFPIFDSASKFRGRGLAYIKTLAEQEREAIRFLQPYDTRDDGWRFVRASLNDLHALHIIDKHRQLHLVTSAHSATVMREFPPDCGFQQTPNWGSVKSESHVETWTFTKPPPKIEQHGGAYLAIALEHGDETIELLALLKEVLYAVACTLQHFSDRFPRVSANAWLGSAYTSQWWRGKDRQAAP
jgi:hypothetical protein